MEYKISTLFALLIYLILWSPFVHSQDNGDNLDLQPQFDQIDITNYLLKERLLKFQLKCVLFDGPCDVVGNWIKPRVKAGLLNRCLKCTVTQEQYMQKWMNILKSYFPEIYRAAVAKYINGQDISVSQEDQKLIEKINSDSGWAEFKVRLHKLQQDIKSGHLLSGDESISTTTTNNFCNLYYLDLLRTNKTKSYL